MKKEVKKKKILFSSLVLYVLVLTNMDLKTIMFIFLLCLLYIKTKAKNNILSMPQKVGINKNTN